jgi:hypothetical protein
LRVIRRQREVTQTRVNDWVKEMMNMREQWLRNNSMTLQPIRYRSTPKE